MTGFAWLNELMTWLGRWVPRVALVKATHVGVLFGPAGRIEMRQPGLLVYWPITHELQLVSTRLRTMELATQIHSGEAIQVVVAWRIHDPLSALSRLNDPAAVMDDRAQAALASAYGARVSNTQLAAATLDALRDLVDGDGIEVQSVAVSQRTHVLPLKMFNDWAVHEGREL